MKHLVLIETSGNQRYIFSTNKLRENVGASELTYQIGTKTVLNAVKEICGLDLYSEDLKTLQQNLLDETKNKPIGKSDKEIEVIIATSGKALLLTNTKEKAKEIVREVTRTALETMPGLTVHGAIVAVEDDLKDIHEAVKNVHRKLEEIRDKMPGNLQRFQRLPFVEPCATSGLPASEIINFKNSRGEDRFAFSKVTTSKRRALAKVKDEIADDSKFKKGRIINLLETVFDVELPENQEKLEEVFPETRWLSVIHADGNGLGEIFLRFDEHLGIKRNDDEKKTFKTKDDARKYVETYRKFSVALDICTINAAGFAIKNLQNLFMKDESKFAVPIIPIILGGDDLTILCDGNYAVKFTKDFLEQFEKETTKISESFEIAGITIKLDYLSDIIDSIQGIIPKIANEAFGVSRLGICAGVAIIKPHYPFHQAYGLAENLLKSAKLVKTKIQHEHNGKKDVSIPSSAMDFHVLYDSSSVELQQIREKLVVDEGETYLYAKPYIVSNLTETPNDKTWFENRTWDRLETRVCAMSATEKDDEGKRKLPNSQLHHIRESLFRGQKETDSDVKLFKHRYSDDKPEKDKGFGKLLCGDSLFFKEKHKETDTEEGHTTHFLDALDVVELWKGFECPKTNVKEQNGGAE